jgi:hypothetical protein
LTEFCSTTKSVFPPWWIPPQVWTEPPSAMTVPTTRSFRNRLPFCRLTRTLPSERWSKNLDSSV